MQVDLLLALQRLDIEIENIKQDAQVFPNQVAQARDKEFKLRTQHETLKARLESCEREERDMTNTFELEDQRLKKSKTKVKQLKTSYEFQALNREIQNTERANTELTENITKKKAEIETLRTQLAAAETLWTTALAEFEKIDAEAKIKTGEFEGILKMKSDEQVKAREGIEKPILSKYLFVQRRYKDAVVPLVGGTCQGCHRNLPPQLNNEIMRNKTLTSCPNCSRLIFVPNA